jgi:phospholipid-binding lipoprotein MlaA
VSISTLAGILLASTSAVTSDLPAATAAVDQSSAAMPVTATPPASAPMLADTVNPAIAATPIPAITSTTSTAPTLPVPAAVMDPTAPSAANPSGAGADQQNGIIVTARPKSVPGDPLLGVNVVSYQVVQKLDDAVVAPVSRSFKAGVPSPIRMGVRNVLNNLLEPIVFLNYVLQHKIGKAGETLGRFTLNSTLGVAGLFDIAKREPFHLPRHPNGFAFTLGYYGIKPGPYMFLPIIGPTTVRDLFGRWVDLLVMPMTLGKPFNQPIYSLSTTVFRALDERVETDDTLEKLRDTPDPYTAVKENYMRNRQAEIDVLRGKRKTVDGPLINEPTPPAVPAPIAAPEPAAPVPVAPVPASLPAPADQ